MATNAKIANRNQVIPPRSYPVSIDIINAGMFVIVDKDAAENRKYLNMERQIHDNWDQLKTISEAYGYKLLTGKVVAFFCRQLNKYVRGKIMDLWKPEEYIYRVLAYDVGQQFFVYIKNMRALSEQLMRLPPLVEIVGLYGVTPYENAANKLVWSKRARDIVKSEVSGSKAVYFREKYKFWDFPFGIVYIDNGFKIFPLAEILCAENEAEFSTSCRDMFDLMTSYGLLEGEWNSLRNRMPSGIMIETREDPESLHWWLLDHWEPDVPSAGEESSLVPTGRSQNAPGMSIERPQKSDKRIEPFDRQVRVDNPISPRNVRREENDFSSQTHTSRDGKRSERFDRHVWEDNSTSQRNVRRKENQVSRQTYTLPRDERSEQYERQFREDNSTSQRNRREENEASRQTQTSPRDDRGEQYERQIREDNFTRQRNRREENEASRQTHFFPRDERREQYERQFREDNSTSQRNVRHEGNDFSRQTHAFSREGKRSERVDGQDREGYSICPRNVRHEENHFSRPMHTFSRGEERSERVDRQDREDYSIRPRNVRREENDVSRQPHTPPRDDQRSEQFVRQVREDDLTSPRNVRHEENDVSRQPHTPPRDDQKSEQFDRRVGDDNSTNPRNVRFVEKDEVIPATIAIRPIYNMSQRLSANEKKVFELGRQSRKDTLENGDSNSFENRSRRANSVGFRDEDDSENINTRERGTSARGSEGCGQPEEYSQNFPAKENWNQPEGRNLGNALRPINGRSEGDGNMRDYEQQGRSQREGNFYPRMDRDGRPVNERKEKFFKGLPGQGRNENQYRRGRQNN